MQTRTHQAWNMQEKAAIDMDFGGIFNKLGNQKLGIAVGALLTEQMYGQARGTNFIGNIQGQMEQLIKDPHMPNLGHVINNLFMPYSPFMPAVIAAIVGYALEEIDVFPSLGNIGTLLKKIGGNVAIGAVAVELIDASTIAHSPVNMGSLFQSNQMTSVQYPY